MVELDGKRTIAWNGDLTDEYGFIWCMVKEDTPGYIPMTGKDELQAPWYLSHFEHHKKEDGTIDMVAARERAMKTAARWNKEQGYTEEDVDAILISSMRLGRN